MKNGRQSIWLGLLAGLLGVWSAGAQARPYIGFIYPAGGQAGTTFQVRIGGQRLDDVIGVEVSGRRVSARLVDYRPHLGTQQVRLLREQSTELRKFTRRFSKKDARKGPNAPTEEQFDAVAAQLAKIDDRLREYVQRPACAAIANLVVVEITLHGTAEPGERELRLRTLSGVSNPMPFHVGALPEHTRPPLPTCEAPVLGKEAQALSRRPPENIETAVRLPCTVNGQISPSEVDRYSFKARKGQKLVLSALARQLVPYLADAVPGWFQPVLEVTDAAGREVAYQDDYRFKPDPVLIFEVPRDGEYRVAIRDAIYRGREDFVYRLSMGELPFVTSVFPQGRSIDLAVPLELTGVNLGRSKLLPPTRADGEGIHMIHRTDDGRVINPVPFAVDSLPEAFEQEPNDGSSRAQPLTVPVIMNGRVGHPGDVDLFKFSGRAGEMVAMEVLARRLDSPLDSVLWLLDGQGRRIAHNDDHRDVGDGLITHPADSYLRVTLPFTGAYQIRLTDTAQAGGREYGYRLRVSAPLPRFALRVVPSSLSLRNGASDTVEVHVFRQDGFAGPITLSVQGLPRGMVAAPVVVSGTQQVARVTVKANWTQMREPVTVRAQVVGSAYTEGRRVTHQVAVPAEDRMQAFLWRHLVPADEFQVHVYDRSMKLKEPPDPVVPPAISAMIAAEAKKRVESGQTFTKGQVRGRLRDLKRLYGQGLLSAGFYLRKVAECEAAVEVADAAKASTK
jgi:hypothetical protein